MAHSNTTHFTNPSTFILLGIPGLEEAHVWISIPFCTMYVIVILGNFIILIIVKRESSLHEPMYYFLCMLGISDLILTTSDLGFLWPWRWIATWPSALTSPVVAKIGLAVLLRSGLLELPLPLLARQWPYCRTNIIPQPYCLHITVVSLACADIRVSSYYALAVTLCGIGLDALFIAISYIHVLRAIFKLPTKDARLKTFGTCSSHLCAILAFYIPNLFIILIARLGQILPLHFHILFANLCFLMSPTLNPIIYGVRTKRIRARLLSLFTQKGI
nr:olfactory receptor 52B2-like [Pelodiscus sinensis]|eukprot:XP_025044446.1 olfactory receptor 52B2-like [Pelodiscus sinensis]